MEGGFDVHTHLLPDDIAEKAAAGAFGMQLVDGFVHVGGFKLQLARMGRPEALVERILFDRLEGAIAAVPPPLFRADMPTEEREDYVAWLNDGLLRTLKADARLHGLAYLPSESPEMALAIARNLSDEWAGVIIGTDLAGASYADESFYPLWACLEKRGLPVLIHPSESKDPRLSRFYLSNLLGNPMETTLAAAQLIFGDIPATFPGLKVILSHGGGATAALLGRWQRGLETARPGINPVGISPVEAGRWFYADTVVHSRPVMELLLEVFGEDHLLLGSDWPFPMGAENAEANVGHLADARKHKFRRENVLNVFGL